MDRPQGFDVEVVELVENVGKSGAAPDVRGGFKRARSSLSEGKVKHPGYLWARCHRLSTLGASSSVPSS